MLLAIAGSFFAGVAGCPCRYVNSGSCEYRQGRKKEIKNSHGEKSTASAVFSITIQKDVCILPGTAGRESPIDINRGKKMEREERVILTNMCMIYDHSGNVLVLDRKDPHYTGVTFPAGM